MAAELRPLRIAGARDLHGAPVGIDIVEGQIAAIGPRLEQTHPDVETLDADGHVALPALVEPHVHLDKTLWGEPWRPNTAGPRLVDYISNERAVLADLSTPVRVRAGRLLEQIVASGSLAVRSHVDVAPDIGLRHIEAMLELKAAYRDLVDLQLVAFPQTGLLTRPGTAELMEEALRLGVETVGGLDPAGIDRDPIRQLEVVFGLAERYGRGVDIHLHDPGELGVWQLERIADFTAAAGLAGRVVISHAYCLGMVGEARLEAIGRRLADLRIALMTSAPADIAVPPVGRLRQLGVTVCCGSDGIRDAWSPMGNGDALERAMLLAFRFDWGKDEELLAALDCASGSAARAIGIEHHGLAVGRPADLVLVAAQNAADAVVSRPRERIVIRAGRVVARDGRLLDSRVPG